MGRQLQPACADRQQGGPSAVIPAVNRAICARQTGASNRVSSIVYCRQGKLLHEGLCERTVNCIASLWLTVECASNARLMVPAVDADGVPCAQVPAHSGYCRESVVVRMAAWSSRALSINNVQAQPSMLGQDCWALESAAPAPLLSSLLWPRS